ncbi:MAG TPA: hypothetical protein VI759_03890 [Dehalococcoidia bacterium]|nr:hypothetical protein [Dehalococcoidia bacterium]
MKPSTISNVVLLCLAGAAILHVNDRLDRWEARGEAQLQGISIGLLVVVGIAIVALNVTFKARWMDYISTLLAAAAVFVAYVLGTSRID